MQPPLAIQQELRDSGNKTIAEHSKRFFKTGPGEYGEGDSFLGIRVPQIRDIAGKYGALPLPETQILLSSAYHEERLAALIILVNKFKKGNPDGRKAIYELYLSNTSFINNWDLVDVSAQHIVGRWLADKDRSTIYRLADSPDLWERRIGVMSTFHFIRQNDYSDTLAIAEQLLNDPHDLIHKATGWMLREIGNRDMKSLERFLQEHAVNMPRTMLRYSIEKLPKHKRKKYLVK